MKLRLFVIVAGIVATAAFAARATADPTNVPICMGAETTALSGSYPGNLTVTGNAYVPDGTTLSVGGNLTIAPGACLDAFTRGNVTVGGNLLVRKGAILGLGCDVTAIGPSLPCITPDEVEANDFSFRTNDVVGGNLIADGAYTMYITASHIRGNLISNGGGDPSLPPPLSFPIKDTTVDGNLIVQGWQGAWMGVLRSTVGGNMIITNNVGIRTGDDGSPDSTEIVANQVSGNLICQHNTPTARFGDAGDFPNTVGGRAIGVCAAISN
jgi:hypothetical protein